MWCAYCHWQIPLSFFFFFKRYTLLWSINSHAAHLDVSHPLQMDGIHHCLKKGDNGLCNMNCEWDQHPNRYLNLYRAVGKHDNALRETNHWKLWNCDSYPLLISLIVWWWATLVMADNVDLFSFFLYRTLILIGLW